MKEVLDSRFIIEHFYSVSTETRRKTTRKLQDLIHCKEGILPTIVISETVRIVCEKVGSEEADVFYSTIVTSGLQIQDLTAKIARQAGLLKCQYRNLPVGDCIIAATAIQNHAIILSDDPHFDVVKEAKRIWI